MVLPQGIYGEHPEVAASPVDRSVDTARPSLLLSARIDDQKLALLHQGANLGAGGAVSLDEERLNFVRVIHQSNEGIDVSQLRDANLHR